MNAAAMGLDTRDNTNAVTILLTPTASRNLLLNDLIEGGVILKDAWQTLDERARRPFVEAPSEEELLTRLVEAQLLTAFQVSHIRSAGSANLVLGNYRLLEEIGAGGMGIVYRGEHVLLRRPVAIKVLRSSPDGEELPLQRFFVEMRALARIRHPNIVWALDAGTVKPKRHDESHRHYLVMEYVAGTNLEVIAAKNPLSIFQACELAYQIAGALDETHKLNLIHRDIKPSNILVTPQGNAKLLDFGLALHFGRRRLTMPGTVLGTLAYMAPEQVSDSANVDIRADIFGLGATLFFCLTGACPFSVHGTITQQAASRLVPQVPKVREHRADVSPELEAVICRMMAHEREDRYSTPQALLRALLPFVNASRRFEPQRSQCDASPALVGSPSVDTATVPRVLLVDDEPGIRHLCKTYLRHEGFQCSDAGNGEEALQLLGSQAFDLVLLDIDMPRLSGAETLSRLRQTLMSGYLKVIMMSGGVSPDDMSAMLGLGADDYLAKPFTRLQLVSRVKAALAHKAIQDRSEWLNRELLQVNAELEQSLEARSGDLSHVRMTLLHALAKIVESRTLETPGHLTRITRYAKAIALQARLSPRLASALDAAFIHTLEKCAPLHDIGNVAMPDHILRHTGPLDAEDRIVMQAHTTIGAETLASVAKRDRTAAAFWQMAIDISRHHHERHDGAGYPDRLAGRDIPVAARLVALADAYDTLRTPGELGIALSHNAAVEMIVQGSQGRFDPLLVQTFQEIESEIDAIFRACPE